MNWIITQTTLQEILPLRDLYLQENNFQIRYHARHERGWTDSYLVSLGDEYIGYGAVAGKDSHDERDSIFEFYMIPSFRAIATDVFQALIQISGAPYLTCQTNDAFFCSLVYQYAQDINAEAILFNNHTTTHFSIENSIFRERYEAETIVGYSDDQMGRYVLELNQELVATGDFYLHYNHPFADLWMEVKATHRKRGIGSYLLQELKRVCYLAGRVPAARCNIDNIASKACLLKAGFSVAGYLVSGTVRS
ncbi:MAG TPA: GNAT family N-acetyltransferase [Chitinophaga sp.]|uniref:GNAT family N-acetyltransferase n=1 Tax=Chitinophaga sp. TaxID=1869181 RepID=UPI002CDF14C1|nr:GNAT family N-acetyltransferase [Chitinophaga sp.]HVI46043.1 GNAT family N-acetyltransferase [Chitinophaga sp.]